MDMNTVFSPFISGTGLLYTVRQPNLHKFVNEQAQSIVRLHGSVICHMNGNFVGFQNMCDFRMSDQ